MLKPTERRFHFSHKTNMIFNNGDKEPSGYLKYYSITVISLQLISILMFHIIIQCKKKSHYNCIFTVKCDQWLESFFFFVSQRHHQLRNHFSKPTRRHQSRQKTRSSHAVCYSNLSVSHGVRSSRAHASTEWRVG